MGKKSKVVILLLLTVIIIYTIAFVLLIKPLLDEAASNITQPSQNVAPIVANETSPDFNVSDIVDSVLSSKDLYDGVDQEIVSSVQSQLPDMVDKSVATALDKKLSGIVDEKVNASLDKDLQPMVDESVNTTVAKKIPTLVEESVSGNVEKKVPLIITNVYESVLENLKQTIPEEVEKTMDSYVDTLLQDERFIAMVKDELSKYETERITKTVAEESGTSVEYVDTLIQESMKEEFDSQKNEIVDRVIDQIKKEDLGKVETLAEVETVSDSNKNEVVTMENGETFELETKPYMEDLNYLSAEEYEKMRQELLNNTVNDILSNLKD